MERLFSPCTRLHELFESSRSRRDSPELLQELNLDVSTEELLSAERAFTYANLFAILENRNAFAWLTPHAAVVHGAARVVNYWDHLDGSSGHFSFSADGKDIAALARSPEHLLEICDVVLRLLAVSIVHSVVLRHQFQVGILLILHR
jgi:hypothetical protein